LHPLVSSKDTAVVVRQDPAPGSWTHKGAPITISSKFASDSSGIASKSQQIIRPDLRGMTIRRAVNILHKNGIKSIVRGGGKVVEQQWKVENKSIICTLICK
jgi:hypothetical protein